MKMIKVKDLTIGQVIIICKKQKNTCKGCPLEDIDQSVCHVILSKDELNKEIEIDD